MCEFHTNIKHENLAFLVSAFDPEMLRIGPNETEQENISAAHAPPLTRTCREDGSLWVLTHVRTPLKSPGLRRETNLNFT